MKTSLLQPIRNLRDALHAAHASTLAHEAPGDLRTQLERSVRLLDGLLLAHGIGERDPAVESQLGLYAHSALAEARIAVTSWHSWTETGA